MIEEIALDFRLNVVSSAPPEAAGNGQPSNDVQQAARTLLDLYTLSAAGTTRRGGFEEHARFRSAQT